LPKDVYIDFVTRSGRHADIVASREQLDFFRRSTIFADDVSCVTLSRLARVAELASFEKDKIMIPPDEELLLLRSGSASLTTPFGYEERLGIGGDFGAMVISRKPPEGTQLRFLEPSEVYQLPLDSFADIPIVRWKLIETNRKRYADRRLVPRKPRNPSA
jgi:signal-transduction protein with cAMP-binding, CBS, and nucleotidyltransferase domain